MKIYLIYSVVGICWLVNSLTRVCAERCGQEYTNLELEVLRTRESDEIIKWVAELVEQEEDDSEDVLHNMDIKLAFEAKSNKKVSELLVELYGKEFNGSVESLIEFVNGLVMDNTHWGLAERNPRVCSPDNYKHLLNAIHWIYSVEAHDLDDTFTPFMANESSVDIIS